MGATPNWIADMTGRSVQGQTTDDELWIDGCGGFRLAVASPGAGGSRWQLGGPDLESPDQSSRVIRIQADVPRIAGELVRKDSEYAWLPEGSAGAGKPVLIGAEHPIPMVGSARLFLNVPSPLSPSAVLTLQPPHRFGGHVDGVVLVTDTVLLGPGRECHVRCPELKQRYVLSLVSGGATDRGVANDAWRLISRGKTPIEMIPNQRLTVDDVSMTLVRPR